MQRRLTLLQVKVINVEEKGLEVEFSEPIAVNGHLHTKRWWLSWGKFKEVLKTYGVKGVEYVK